MDPTNYIHAYITYKYIYIYIYIGLFQLVPCRDIIEGIKIKCLQPKIQIYIDLIPYYTRK
jgi:hypothetical protein